MSINKAGHPLDKRTRHTDYYDDAGMHLARQLLTIVVIYAATEKSMRHIHRGFTLIELMIVGRLSAYSRQ